MQQPQQPLVEEEEDVCKVITEAFLAAFVHHVDDGDDDVKDTVNDATHADATPLSISAPPFLSTPLLLHPTGAPTATHSIEQPSYFMPHPMMGGPVAPLQIMTAHTPQLYYHPVSPQLGLPQMGMYLPAVQVGGAVPMHLATMHQQGVGAAYPLTPMLDMNGAVQFVMAPTGAAQQMPPNPTLDELMRQLQQQQRQCADVAAPSKGKHDKHHGGHHAPPPANPNPDLVDVFDPTYCFSFEVPKKYVSHVPPARMNITRFVFCRNYVPGDSTSCSVGDGCKFVHVDVDIKTLQAHSVHVKYAWRTVEVCTYQRLPAGELLRVAAPNNRPPVEEIPSERVLVTQGTLRRHDPNNTSMLSHCAHYYFNRMCNRGEQCHFVHVVHVDPTVTGDFKRTPARCGMSIPRVQTKDEGGCSMRNHTSAPASAEGTPMLPGATLSDFMPDAKNVFSAPTESRRGSTKGMSGTAGRAAP